MKYKTKSIIVSRTSREDQIEKDPEEQLRPCWVCLFDENDPHKKGLEPKDIIQFDRIHKIIFNDMKQVNFLLPGTDILINDLKEIEVETDGPHLFIDFKN